MPLKTFKPTTPSLRFTALPAFEEITKSTPEKSLLRPLNKTGGRNNLGNLTSRHRGGGHKRRYRVIDFKRDKDGIPGRVATIEYDPNRSARIALLFYADGEKRYIIAPVGVKVGDVLNSGPEAEIRAGNSLPLSHIPLGIAIHNVELRRGRGAQLGRGAGAEIQFVARDEKYAQIKLPSGEIRMVPVGNRATIGQVGNVEHENISLGKAGRKRWLGRRPHVRGVAMNPVDHPMGGGEGKTSGGRHPCSPWGQKSKGLKTRKRKNISNRFIIKRRDKK